MASDAHIKIIIGAAKSASVDRVFRDIRKDSRKIGSELGKYFNRSRKGVDGYAAAVRGLTNTVKTQGKEEEKQSRARSRRLSEEERQARKLQAARDYVHRLRMRQIHQESEAQARSARREEHMFRSRMQRFARISSHRSTRFFWGNAPITSMAARAGRDIARGIGLDMYASSHLSNVVGQETLANKITTQAYQPGAAGAAGQRVDPRALRSEMRALVKQYGVQGGTGALLQAGAAYVGQRGNLQGFRDIAPELTKRITAYSLDAGEAGLMAAKIESALANQAEFSDDTKRNDAVIGLIDNLIQQGKIGSVEGADLAKQLPKLSGIAGLFSGDVVRNMKELVTVMQLAERGPAKNSATASTYAQNFALDISKRADQFKSIGGVDIFDADGRLKALSEVIPEVIANTAGTKKVKIRGKGEVEMNQVQQLQAILPNKRSFLALQEFLTVFTGAGGGQKGRSALENEFKRFSKGSVTEDVNSSLEAVSKTTANRVEKLNASFEDAADKLAEQLVPALEKASPALVQLADTLAEWAVAAVENPGKAIAAAIALSIGRSLTETFFRVTMEKALTAGAPAMGKLLAQTVGANVGSIAIKSGAAISVGTAAFYGTLELMKWMDKDVAANDRTLGLEGLGMDLSDVSNMGKTGDLAKEALRQVVGPSIYDTVGQLFGGDSEDESVDLSQLRSDNPRIAAEAKFRARQSLAGGGKSETRDPEAIDVLNKIHRTLSGTLQVEPRAGAGGVSSQAGDPN